jgi:hypothetical protein
MTDKLLELQLHRDRLITELHRLAAAGNTDPMMLARLGEGIVEADAAIRDLKSGRFVFVDDGAPLSSPSVNHLRNIRRDKERR